MLRRLDAQGLNQMHRTPSTLEEQSEQIFGHGWDFGVISLCLFHFVYGASPHQILLHLPIILLHLPIKFASFPPKIASSPQQVASFPQQIASFPQTNSHFPITILLPFAEN